MRCETDIDEVLAYQTPKITVLKDWKLGLIAISLKLLIFCYIVLWTILHKGRHLKEIDMKGLNRLSVRHPVQHLCDVLDVDCNSNFTDWSELPYCSESKKTYTDADQKKRCSLWDYVQMTLPWDKGMILATSVRRFDEERECKPSEDNDWACAGEPFQYISANGTKQREPGAAVPRVDEYIADIERYTVLIDHACMSANGEGTQDRVNRDMQGYVEECPHSSHAGAMGCAPWPIPCLYDKCPAGAPKPSKGEAQSKGALASSLLASGSAVSLNEGDIFTLGTLLRLANVDLDEAIGGKENLRTRGLVLNVGINYDNRPAGGFLGLKVAPWKVPEIAYSYTVVPLEDRDFHWSKTVDDPGAATRVVRIYSGVRLLVQQSGTLVRFDMSFFLVTVSAALGLLAVANTITDMAMMYLLARSEEYRKRKFFFSKDMNPEPEAGLETGLAKFDGHLDNFIEALHSQDKEVLAKTLPLLLKSHDKRTTP